MEYRFANAPVFSSPGNHVEKCLQAERVKSRRRGWLERGGVAVEHIDRQEASIGVQRWLATSGAVDARWNEKRRIVSRPLPVFVRGRPGWPRDWPGLQSVLHSLPRVEGTLDRFLAAGGADPIWEAGQSGHSSGRRAYMARNPSTGNGPKAQAAWKVDIVVIGAGQAGLSAAYHLARRGREPLADFVLLDAAPSPGVAVPLADADAVDRQPHPRPAGHGVFRNAGRR